MASTFPTTIDTFTTKTNANNVEYSHINDLQNSVIAIQTHSAFSGTEVWVSGTTSGSIQATINSITDASSSTPYVVKIPPGIYEEQITCKDYVSLLGTAVEKTSIQYSKAYVATLTLANYITIENLSVSNTSGWGINAADTLTDLTIGNCYIYGKAYAIRSFQKSINNFTIYNTKMESEYIGFAAGGLNINIYSSEIYIKNLSETTHRTSCIAQDNDTTANFFGCRLYSENTQTTLGYPAYVAWIFSSQIANINFYNCQMISRDSGGIANSYGLYMDQALSTINVYGGQVTASGGANTYDLYQAAGTLNVYGTDYKTSTGTISGDSKCPGTLTGNRFVSEVTIGTQPYAATSTTLNSNLNADLLDGYHQESFSRNISRLLTVDISGNGNYTTIQAANNAAITDGATLALPTTVLTYPGTTLDYTPNQAVKVLPIETLWSPRQAVTLEKEGTYSTIKAAVAAAGNAPILVIPTTVVSPGTGTLADAIAAASTGDILLLENGAYSEDATDISKDLHIIGESREGTIITGTAFIATAAVSMANLTLNCGGDEFQNTGTNIYAYNVDFENMSSPGGLTHLLGDPVIELRYCRLYSVDVGTIDTNLATTCTIQLDHCYLELRGDALGAGTPICQLGTAAVLNARYTTFANIPIDAAAGSIGCICNGGGSLGGTLDHCYILEDVSACASITGGSATGILASDAADDISLIDCVVSVLVPADQDTYHLEQTAGALRHVGTTVPTGQIYNEDGTIIDVYKIDPLAR